MEGVVRVRQCGLRRRRHARSLRSTCAAEHLRVRVRVRAGPACTRALRRHLHGPTQIIQNSGNLFLIYLSILVIIVSKEMCTRCLQGIVTNPSEC